MANSAIISAGIQAAGGLAQSLLGKKPRTYGPGEVLRKTVGEARELGIHPLAALGTVSPYTGSAPVNIGDGLANAAGALAHGIEQNSDEKQKRRDKAAADAVSSRLVQAQIEEIESATALNVARAQSIMSEAARAAKNPVGGYGQPEQPALPKIKDKGAGLHRILGVEVPAEMADEDEAAGGDILGGAETTGSWLGKALTKARAMYLKSQGYAVAQGNDGQWYVMSTPKTTKRADRSGAHPWNR